MNRSKETSTATDGNYDKQKKRSGMTDPIEIELDTQQLRALDPSTEDRSPDEEAALSRDLIDTATNLELSQSLEDLRNLSWPGLKPGAVGKTDK